MTQGKWQTALQEWHSQLDSASIVTACDAIAIYEANATGMERKIRAVLKPTSTEEVQNIVRVASRNRTPLYPVSRGRNWGYGSRLPVIDGCAVVDLGGMDSIRNADAVSRDHPFAVVEPGVTQRMLYDTLCNRELPLLFNCTGAGCDTSILGNALERGIGYFGGKAGDLSALEVVLGTGEILRTGFGHTEGASTVHAYPAGLGPSLDGLFCQSNFGIVTAAGFRLRRRSECHAAVVVSLHDAARFPEFVDRLARLRSEGVFDTAFHLGSPNRTQMTLGPFVYQGLVEGGAPPGASTREKARELLAARQFPSWTGATAIMGARSMVDAAFSEFSRVMGALARVERIDEDTPPEEGVGGRIHREILGLTMGIPSDASLQSPFWVLDESTSDPTEDLDRGDLGILFCCPTLPFDGRSAGEVAKIADATLRPDFEPFITLNAISADTLVCVLNIVFRRSEPGAGALAHDRIEALYRAFANRGYFPYRLGIQSMSAFVREDAPYWETVRALKSVFDPNHIIAPGRYCPV